MAKPKKWNEMSAAEQATENEGRATAKATRMTAEKAALAAESEKVGRPAEKGKGKLAKSAKAALAPATNVPGPEQSAGTIVTKAPPVEAPTKPSAPATGKPIKRVNVKSPALPGAKATAHPSAPIKPSPADIHLPTNPLPNQGSRANLPVESVTTKVSPKILTPEGAAKWNAAKDAERRITQGAGPQAERRAAAAAQAVVAPTAPTGMPKMQAGDLFQSVSHARSPMTAADIGLQTGPLSVKQRIGRALGDAAKGVTKWSGTAMGKGFKAVGKSAIGPIIDPIRGFRAGSAARAEAWEEAGIMGKAALVGTTSAELGWAGAKTAGGLARGVAYGIAVDMGHEFAGHYGEVKAEREIEAERRAEYGEKYGLKVTTAPPTLLRMETGGSPKIKVEEVDKSLRAKKLAQGQSKFDERTYNALKKVASRNVSKGSSQN